MRCGLSCIVVYKIDEEAFLELDKEFGYEAVSQEEREEESFFYAAMGGEAIKDALAEMDLLELKQELETVSSTSSLKLIPNFVRTSPAPEYPS